MSRFFRCFVSWTLLVIAGAGAQVATTSAQTATDVSSHPWIGEPAPEFSLKKVGGGEMSLVDLRGKYVVIHFGTSW